MRPIVITRQLDAADADGICLSQALGAAGNFTLNGAFVSGGVATLDTQRKVLFTPAADESARTFTIFGTDSQGRSISESLSGAAVPFSTVRDYLTVTRIAVNMATAGALTVGTSGVGASAEIPLDIYVPNSRTTISLDITGTVNVTVEMTNDNPFGLDTESLHGYTPATPGPFLWFNHPIAALVGTAVDAIGATDTVMRAVRLLTNSGTGTVVMTVTQQSVYTA